MTDIAIAFSGEAKRFDLAATVTGDGYNGLRDDQDLATAAAASLFTWGRADDEDQLPGFDDDRKGWWGDAYAPIEGDRQGCRWWVLAREILNDVTAERARQMGEEALAWMVRDGVVNQVVVRTARAVNRLAVFVRLIKPDGRAIDFRFDDVWQQITGGVQ